LSLGIGIVLYSYGQPRYLSTPLAAHRSVDLQFGLAFLADAHPSPTLNTGQPNPRPLLAAWTDQHHVRHVYSGLNLNTAPLRLLATSGDGALVLDHSVDTLYYNPILFGVNPPHRATHPQIIALNDFNRISSLDLHSFAPSTTHSCALAPALRARKVFRPWPNL
jgi:hypothetical protein